MNAPQPAVRPLLELTTFGNSPAAEELTKHLNAMPDDAAYRRAHRACSFVISHLGQHLRAIDHIPADSHTHLVKLLRNAAVAQIAAYSNVLPGEPAAGCLRSIVYARCRAARERRVDVARGPVGLISQMLTELAEPPFRLSPETSSTAYAVITTLRS